MSSIIYTFFMVVLWIVNLFNGTGLGNTYHITEYAKIIVCGLAVLLLILNYKKRNGLLIETKEFLVYIFLFVFFGISSYIHGYGLTCLNYLWVYFVSYLVGQLAINDKCIKYTSACYGILGVFVLCIYNYGSFLSGWNPNSIAMIGLHSFLVCLIPYYKNRKTKDRLVLIVIAIVYALLIYPTGSRSSIIFAFVAIGFSLIGFPEKLTVSNNFLMWLWLFLPLVIALSAIFISHTSIVNELNIWSLEKFQKPIFNGRDTSWEAGLQNLLKSPFWGTGYINGGYYHNSAITCLAAFGIGGFVLWINSFYSILHKGRKWIADYIVVGSVISFLALYAQQSLELGLFSEEPTLFPYVILGILLGRIRYLKRTL